MKLQKMAPLCAVGLMSVLACSASVSDDGGSGGSATGSGGTTFGAGGTTFGAGGTTFGAGGTTFGAGGATVGAGGATVGAGGATVGAGGATVGANCSAASWTAAEGYIDNGTLCGYAWTATNMNGETITPPCGTGDCFTGTTICADATIPPVDETAMTYTGVMIGWNVAQASGQMAAGTWPASFTSLTPTFALGGATGETRIILKSGSTDYCATASSGVAIPFASFKTECWGTTGVALAANAPISAAILQVNGDATTQTLSGFCLQGIALQ